MPDTPPNTATAATLKVEAQSTPVNAKLRDRAKGNDKIRALADQAMVQEARYVEISVEDFMKKFLPVSCDPFDKNDHNTELDTTRLDVKGSDSKNEKACYPDLVSGPPGIPYVS